MALLVKSGEIGYPAALTTRVWGYYDAAFGGNEFKFQRPYGTYVMENVLFKISFPAGECTYKLLSGGFSLCHAVTEFHAQTAVECAMILHDRLREQGRSTDDIASIRLRTQEAAMRSVSTSAAYYLDVALTTPARQSSTKRASSTISRECLLSTALHVYLR